MVNTGHPSRACKLCRARRIKCDETKPHCLKCKKSKRQCPGYRDPFEINLRDETQATIRKVKAAAAAQKRASRHDDQDISSDDSATKSAKSAKSTKSAHSRSGSNASVIMRRGSPQISEASWDTMSKSAWPSPASEAAVLQGATLVSPMTGFSSPNTTLISPTTGFSSPHTTDLLDATIFDFCFPSSAASPAASSSTQEFAFDFNSAWHSPNSSWYASSPVKDIASSMPSTFDGSTWGLKSPLDDPFSWSYSPPLMTSLQTPLDEQATCFFLSNYVVTLTNAQSPCLFSFVLKLLQWDNLQDTPFPMAFTAVSLAALAGRPNSRHLLSTSRIYYSTALVQLKEALKDKERAKQDTSLAAAILLSFYEGLACEDERMAGWSNHLNGAKTLIRLRGKDVIKESSPEGLEMFQLVRSMSIRQYMFGFVGNPAPGEVEWWGQHEITDKSGHVALVLNMKTTLIRAEADALLTSGPKTAEKIGKALDLLRRAREIVIELGRWLDNCHPTWPRFVSGWVDDVADAKLNAAEAFSGPIYGYPNVWVAGKHLNTNASRIMLSWIMVRCVQWICSPSDHTKTDDYAEAMKIGREEVANVIAGVPYFVSWSGDSATTPNFPCGAPTSPKGYSAILAIYPLLCTGLSPFVTTRQKKWLCGRLRFMSESMGILQADLFAKFISQSPTNLGHHEGTTQAPIPVVVPCS